MIAYFVQILKHFRKISNAAKWIFFRGSIPPNFISFRLEKQTTEVVNTPDSHPADASTVDPPVSEEPQSQSLSALQSQAEDITSTHSVDSDPDVTTYAESMVHQLES